MEEGQKRSAELRALQVAQPTSPPQLVDARAEVSRFQHMVSDLHQQLQGPVRPTRRYEKWELVQWRRRQWRNRPSSCVHETERRLSPVCRGFEEFVFSSNSPLEEGEEGEKGMRGAGGEGKEREEEGRRGKKRRKRRKSWERGRGRRGRGEGRGEEE